MGGQMAQKARGAAKAETRRRMEGWAPVARRTVQQEIADRLREAILSGRFQPGDRLVELDLCASLGVSRPSLREALRSLHAERLVELIPNRGPHIPVLTWEDADGIYQVRALLEGEAAALCAARIDAKGVAELEAALGGFRSAVAAGDPAGRIEATARFYALILDYSGNRIIEEVLAGLLARINLLRARSMAQRGRTRSSVKELSAIFDAIRLHDAEKARHAARHHVEMARDAARKGFTQP